MADWGYDEHADWGTSNPSPRSRIFEDKKYLRLTEESEEYYEALKKSTKVKFIYFCGQFRQWDLALDALRENKSITGCSIDVMGAANETLKAVAEYLSLSKVKQFGLGISPLEAEQIDDQLIEKVAKAIESDHYIQEITIRGEYDTKVQLFEALKSHPTIKQLRVEFISFSKPLINLIASTIKNSPNIKELSLSGIPEEYNFVQPLVDLTRVNDNLTRLEFLEGCFTGDQVIQFLKDLVQAESKLKGIHFDMCYVSGHEKEIGEFLAANLPLESFGLRLAGLGQNEDNIQYLIEGLAKNTHLTELDLRENSLDLRVLLPALKNNRSITSFDFRGNKLQEFNLLEELNNNTLRVFKTGLSRDEPLSLKPIWHSLKHNQTLTNINLAHGDNTYEHDFPVSLVDVDNFKDMMKVNRSITKLKLNEKIVAAVPELTNLIQSFTERNKLEQRLNVTNTLQTIATISKSKSFLDRLPKEIWRNIISYISYPGVVMDFSSKI